MDASWFNTPFNRTSAASPPKESARQLNLDHEHGTLFTLLGKKSLDEGHGFSRAVNDTALDRFSHWGTFAPSSKFASVNFLDVCGRTFRVGCAIAGAKAQSLSVRLRPD